MHGIVLYCLCITILYKNVTIKKESKIMRNLTKPCIQNCKFVRVLDKYATVLLGLKESNLPKTSLIIISSTILPSVSSATCQLLKFWHAQKAKFQDNYPPPTPHPLLCLLYLFLFLGIWLPLIFGGKRFCKNWLDGRWVVQDFHWIFRANFI